MVSFSMAYEDSKKAARIYTGTAAASIGSQLTVQNLESTTTHARPAVHY